MMLVHCCFNVGPTTMMMAQCCLYAGPVLRQPDHIFCQNRFLSHSVITADIYFDATLFQRCFNAGIDNANHNFKWIKITLIVKFEV